MLPIEAEVLVHQSLIGQSRFCSCGDLRLHLSLFKLSFSAQRIQKRVVIQNAARNLLPARRRIAGCERPPRGRPCTSVTHGASRDRYSRVARPRFTCDVPKDLARWSLPVSNYSPDETRKPSHPAKIKTILCDYCRLRNAVGYTPGAEFPDSVVVYCKVCAKGVPDLILFD